MAHAYAKKANIAKKKMACFRPFWVKKEKKIRQNSVENPSKIRRNSVILKPKQPERATHIVARLSYNWDAFFWGGQNYLERAWGRVSGPWKGADPTRLFRSTREEEEPVY